MVILQLFVRPTLVKTEELAENNKRRFVNARPGSTAPFVN